MTARKLYSVDSPEELAKHFSDMAWDQRRRAATTKYKRQAAFLLAEAGVYDVVADTIRNTDFVGWTPTAGEQP
jgi:hypothetical protein